MGWTLSQDDAFECEYSNYLPAKVGSSYFNKWQGSGNLTDRSIMQQLSGLPAGKYRVAVRTSASTIHPGASLIANSDKADMTQLTDNTVSVTTEITDGTLTFGVELKNYQSNDCKFDHFTLEYLGHEPIVDGISTHQSQASTLNPQIYDLLGRRSARLMRGLNIVGGKKIVKK